MRLNALMIFKLGSRLCVIERRVHHPTQLYITGHTEQKDKLFPLSEGFNLIFN
jgi:hypothetical protein